MIISDQHKINISVKKILIIQLGDIGDVVWAIPAFWAAKNGFPEADVCILTRKPYGDLLLDDPHISRVFQVGKQTIWDELKLLKSIRCEKFDLIFDLRADDRGAFISFFSGAKMRGALYYPGIDWRNRMFTHLANLILPKERVLGAAEQSLKIVRSFGIKEITTIPQIVVSEKIKSQIKNILIAENITSPKGFVTINPFSRWSYKEWGMNQWGELISFIWRCYSMPAIIVGSLEERSSAAELVSASNNPMHNLAGKTTLQEMAGLLQMSSLHIGVDSAAPHIASAVGTPTLTIYGPTDWREWSPPGEKNKVVLSDMDCSPCYKKGCNGSGRSECLENLTVAKVWDVVEAMMNNNLINSSNSIEVKNES